MALFQVEVAAVRESICDKDDIATFKDGCSKLLNLFDSILPYMQTKKQKPEALTIQVSSLTSILDTVKLFQLDFALTPDYVWTIAAEPKVLLTPEISMSVLCTHPIKVQVLSYE